MRFLPGQLSLLETDDPPEKVASEEATRQVRQAATADDKSASRKTRLRRTTRARRPTVSQHAAAYASLLTTGEAAELLHVHPRTVQRLVERGQLCAVHLGSAVRFDPDDVTILIERVKRERTLPAASNPVRARGRASTSFADRLRSRQHEHRTAKA